MSTVKQQMKIVDEELQRLDAEIARLQTERTAVARLRARLAGESPPLPSEPRKRAANIKPLILDIMKSAGTFGRTSGDVTAEVKEIAPSVARDTVGSILSRLKAAKALVYDGERYYDTRFAPKTDPRPFEPRVVG
jgi:hypothetical protein